MLFLWMEHLVQHGSGHLEETGDLCVVRIVVEMESPRKFHLPVSRKHHRRKAAMVSTANPVNYGIEFIIRVIERFPQLPGNLPVRLHIP